MTDMRRDDGYEISTDRSRFDVDVFHRYLSDESYWAAGRSREIVETSVAGSIVFGAYAPDGSMVGAARVVTDGATFSWVADVFVLEAHRGRGLASDLMRAVMEHPEAGDHQRMVLATIDAHALYEDFGFVALTNPEHWMIRHRRETGS